MISDGTTVARLTDGTWEFSWLSGTPPYSIWLDGQLLATQTETSYNFIVPGYETAPPDLEILNAGDPSQNQLYPPRQILQWRGVQSAFCYVINKLVGSTWVRQASVLEKAKGYYQWLSPPQPDDTDVQYQIVATDINGNAGTPISFNIWVVRNPRHPTVLIDIGSSGNIVVSA